jgi:hypothetical protein
MDGHAWSLLVMLLVAGLHARVFSWPRKKGEKMVDRSLKSFRDKNGIPTTNDRRLTTRDFCSLLLTFSAKHRLPLKVTKASN